MKRIALAILIVLLIGLAAGAAAHPGGTDGIGGHYDRSTGVYHFHHGHPAHNHSADGTCPYEPDRAKATNKPTITPSPPRNASKKTKATAKPTATPKPKKNEKTTAQKVARVAIPATVMFSVYGIPTIVRARKNRRR